MVLHVIGVLLACVGLSMVFALGFSVYYGDAGQMPLAISMAVTVACGALLHFVFKPEAANGMAMNHREGMAITALGWASAGIFGALPFILADSLPTVTDCVFESFSGFTTTGASALRDIEALPPGILFWRSLSHWLGGMGIIVLSLAILPFLGVGGMQLYKAEVPGPVVDKLRPRIKDTAMMLWKVYMVFSLVEAVLLMLGGMTLFDALCHTFGTMATGGFSTKNASVGHYGPYIQYVITFFMLVAGVNFSLHFKLFSGRGLEMLRDPEFKFFLGFFALCTGAIFFITLGEPHQGVEESFRHSAFQVASILTTTGYGTSDYEVWPYLGQVIMLLCMFIGGSAGSTSGGMKCMRIMLLIKQSYRELFRLIHPKAVSPVKFGRRKVPDEVLSGVMGFSILWLSLMMVSSLLVAATGVDVMTSFTSVLASIGNIGPGLGLVGPTDNYADIPTAAKWVLIVCQLLGRLEIYTVMVLLVPEFWRK